MKKVNFKGVLKMLFVAFALFFAGVNDSTAQVASTTVSAYGTGEKGSVYLVPDTGNFVDPAEAFTLIESAYADIKANGTGASPAVINVLENQWDFFDAIVVNIQNGDDVHTAIINALRLMGSDVHGLSQAQLQALKQMAIDLLTD